MLAVLVNAAAILAGGLLGLLFGTHLPPRSRDGALSGVGFGVVLIGLATALGSHGSPVVVVLALAVGGAVGGALRLADRLDRLRARGGSGGFVLASMVFCVGPMAIVGSLQAGLAGDPSTLLAKAVLDGTTSAIFSSTLGASVLPAALPVLVYQGAIVLSANVLRPVVAGPAEAAIAGAGGLLIAGIGLNLLGVARLRVADLLPGLAVAALLAWTVARLGLRIP